MSDALDALRDAMQHDPGGRGLRSDPARNLVTACSHDFRAACKSLAEHPRPCLAIITGFLIPTATPIAGETDGPLGAIFLARALVPLGFDVVLVTDAFGVNALRAGLTACALQARVPIVALPSPRKAATLSDDAYAEMLARHPITHLLALERVGPSHTLESLQDQLLADGALGQTYLDFLDACPPEHQDRCHTMHGFDLTPLVSPAHRLFERRRPGVATLGIGDGGNEIGMGKIPWDVICRNVPGGGLIACRVATDQCLVAGVSNWGAYALAAGIAFVRGTHLKPSLFDTAIERRFLETMVRHGPLVDGVLGRPSATVDGLAWETYANALTRIGAIVRGNP